MLIPLPARFLLACLLALICFTACQDDTSATETLSPTERAGIDTYLPLAINGVPLQAQIAITPGEQAKGLMHRQALPPDGGMLFVKLTPGPMSFWMRNTPLPLDLGYFDSDGYLREVHALHPFDETPVKSRTSDLQWALEMNQGWFAAKGLKPGAKLDLNLLRQALRQRGSDPIAFGLE